jgi:hypothetical protein
MMFFGEYNHRVLPSRVIPARLRRSEVAAIRKAYQAIWTDRQPQHQTVSVLLDDTPANRSLLKLGSPVARVSLLLDPRRQPVPPHGDYLTGVTGRWLLYLGNGTGPSLVADHSFQVRTSMTEFCRVASLGLRTCIGFLKEQRSALAVVFAEESDDRG